MALDWSQCDLVESVPGKVSGAWVLRGTRMPVQAVFENLEGGVTVQEVTEIFPVTREQVEGLLHFVTCSLAIPNEVLRNRAVYFATNTDQPALIPGCFADWLALYPTAENIEFIRKRLGDEALGIIQRCFAERMFGMLPNGEYDLQNLYRIWSQFDEAFLREFFGSGFQKMKDLAITSTVVAPDPGWPGHRKRSFWG